MNTRIQALADQCRIEEYNQHGDLIEFGFDQEKFAELIVRECITSLDENDGSVHHSECLLEHFGVEE